jgi:hypothetical protein
MLREQYTRPHTAVPESPVGTMLTPGLDLVPEPDQNHTTMNTSWQRNHQSPLSFVPPQAEQHEHHNVHPDNQSHLPFPNLPDVPASTSLWNESGRTLIVDTGTSPVTGAKGDQSSQPLEEVSPQVKAMKEVRLITYRQRQIGTVR